ncbi:MAG: hypothetical protein LQ340_006711 [Diploschistes diacapsis]|nr:MAG: hypothetical protein LQ340_006711 [Diploschistes diacapsis]
MVLYKRSCQELEPTADSQNDGRRCSQQKRRPAPFKSCKDLERDVGFEVEDDYVQQGSLPAISTVLSRPRGERNDMGSSEAPSPSRPSCKVEANHHCLAQGCDGPFGLSSKVSTLHIRSDSQSASAMSRSSTNSTPAACGSTRGHTYCGANCTPGDRLHYEVSAEKLDHIVARLLNHEDCSSPAPLAESKPDPSSCPDFVPLSLRSHSSSNSGNTSPLREPLFKGPEGYGELGLRSKSTDGLSKEELKEIHRRKESLRRKQTNWLIKLGEDLVGQDFLHQIKNCDLPLCRSQNNEKKTAKNTLMFAIICLCLCLLVERFLILGSMIPVDRKIASEVISLLGEQERRDYNKAELEFEKEAFVREADNKDSTTEQAEQRGVRSSRRKSGCAKLST